MRNRYRLFYFKVITIHFICSYYVMCFCSTYINSNSNWLKGVLIGILIDYLGIKGAVPLVKTILRKCLMHFQSKALVKVYSFWVRLMALLRPKRIIS